MVVPIVLAIVATTGTTWQLVGKNYEIPMNKHPEQHWPADNGIL